MFNLKQLFCYRHAFKFVRNIYGEEINQLNARSIWKCSNCDKITYLKVLRSSNDKIILNKKLKKIKNL